MKLKALLLSLLLATPAAAQSSYPLTDPFLYKHLAANATTTIKSGAGVLAGFCINTKGASANTITIYDNTAGSSTIIAAFDSTVSFGCFTYNVGFQTGLTVVIATGTAADVTVAYR